MQIVIDIPEEDYNFVKKQVADGITNPLKMRIANGTPLPKGHGRIGDFDTFLKGFLFDKRADNLECGWIRELIEQVTIIGADKE